MNHNGLQSVPVKHVVPHTFPGPSLGSVLYSCGGFLLPYLVVASFAFIMAILQVFVVPKVQTDEPHHCIDPTKFLTFTALFKVIMYKR
jgi:hypothetical protein